MSEADSPKNAQDLPEVISATAEHNSPVAAGEQESAATLQALENEWETVDFPGAISVDSIPRDAELLVAPGNVELAALMQQLQQENAELRDRVTQLEQDVAQGQIELQLETARFAQAEAAFEQEPDIAQITQELATAQDRLTQLFQELELAHQTSQRQQILVETLTEQLESSQERIAQLERECSSTQQRCNEQLQQLLQAENTCHDLRMRLHRQQQQTLQFKAALEKCLDMTTASRQAAVMAPETESFSVVDFTEDVLGQIFTPHTQPVKPWSAETTKSSGGTISDYTGWSKPLAKLLNLDVANAASTSEPESQTSSNDQEVINLAMQDAEFASELINHIFAETAENQPQESSLQQPNDIFDLAPFLEAGELNLDQSYLGDVWEQPLESSVTASDLTPAGNGVVQNNASEIATEQTSDASDPSEDHLWSELAKLIELDTPDAHASLFMLPDNAESQDSVALDQLAPDTADVDRANQSSALEEATSERSAERSEADEMATQKRKSLKLLPLFPAEQQDFAQNADKPSSQSQAFRQRTLAYSSMGQSTSTTIEAAQLEEAVLAADSSWPSPVVNAAGSGKKRKSMAAVELPTFSKAR